MGRILTAAEWDALFHTYESTAFRLELQGRYADPVDDVHAARFLAGDPITPDSDPEFVAYFAQVAGQVADGKRIERVRVQECPATDYQRWERWAGAWNEAAGERIRYLTRPEAERIGLLPAVGDDDWWLFDSTYLAVMHFDDDGNRLGDELVTDPVRVAQACMWRDLAISHSTPGPRLQDLRARP